MTMSECVVPHWCLPWRCITLLSWTHECPSSLSCVLPRRLRPGLLMRRFLSLMPRSAGDRKAGHDGYKEALSIHPGTSHHRLVCSVSPFHQSIPAAMKLPSSLLVVCLFSTVAPRPTPLVPAPEPYAATESRPLPSRDASYARVLYTFGGNAQNMELFTYPPYPHRRAALDAPPHDEADSHDLLKREAHLGFNKGNSFRGDRAGVNIEGGWGGRGGRPGGGSFFDKRVEQEAAAS